MLDPTLDLALASIGTSLAELRASTPEIVVFGSRAADVARANSDWDILCVGRETSRATPKIDLLWVTADSLRTEQWTGSELAGHISTWGTWIWGTRSWRAGLAPSSFSLTLKERRIVSRSRAMRLTWEGLSCRATRREREGYARRLAIGHRPRKPVGGTRAHARGSPGGSSARRQRGGRRGVGDGGVG